MTCVDEWDTSISVPINDTQFDNRPFCRSFNYYVDPDSESVVELGTQEYPYKDIGYAFIELLNYHSHSDKNVTVYVKENTKNYLFLNSNYIVNTTNVDIVPYSSDPDAIPSKALLIGTDTGSIGLKPGTSFNIMKTFENRVNEIINNNSRITDVEKGYLQIIDHVVVVIRSNFMIDNMEFETEYGSLLYQYVFLFFIWIQEKTIILRNQHWRTSGAISLTYDPLNILIENIDVDYHRNLLGFIHRINCNYPEAVLEGNFITRNFTIYYAKERAVIPTVLGSLYYNGPGDYFVEDYSSKIWSQINEPYAQVTITFTKGCDKDTDRIKYFNYTNLYFELPNKEGSYVNSIAGLLDASPYREYRIFITNITRANCLNSLYATVLIYANYNTEIIVKDSFITNTSTVHALELYIYFRKVTIENMLIEKSDSLAQQTMFFSNIDEVILKNITVQDCDFTGSDLTGLFYFLSPDPYSVTVSGFSIINSKLGYRSGFESTGLNNVSLSLRELMFENVTLNTDAALIKTGSVINLSISDSTFTKVKQVTANDNSISMIKLGILMVDSGNDFMLTNFTAQQSSVTLIEVTSVTLSSSAENQLKISDIIYKDSTLEHPQDLMIVNDMEEEYAFDIVMSNIKMFNLTFGRDGNLFRFEHQTYSGIQLFDCSFSGIKGGSLYLGSSSSQVTAINSKLSMSNITVDDMKGRSKSFIIVSEGGELTVQDSVFSNSYNLEGGSIVQSSGQTAVASFTNCIFANNSALYGGVTSIEERGVIRFYDSTFSSNFAPQAGVIQLRSDGYVELYECTIENNFAISSPVIELFITSSQSVISNSSINSNAFVTKEEVLEEFENCERLCFLNKDYKAYLIEDEEWLDIKTIKYSIQSISSSLEIRDETVITDELYFISSYLSNITISTSIIAEISSDDIVMRVADSTVNIRSLQVESIHTNTGGIFISTSAGTSLNVDKLTFKNSTMKLMRIFDTDVVLSSLIINHISLNDNVLSFYNCPTVSILDASITQVSTSAQEIVSLLSSNIDLVRNLTIADVDSSAIRIEESTVSEMHDIEISNAPKALILTKTDLMNLHSSTIRQCGIDDLKTGGAILISNSNSNISENFFENNFAQKGGAIYIECDNYEQWDNNIIGNIFRNNRADKEGGAISYNFRRPIMNNNTFVNNTAVYGADVSSYAVRIVQWDNPDQSIKIINIVSGIKYEQEIQLCLVDVDNQQMVLDNSSTIKILPTTMSASISGDISSQVSEGKSTFQGITFKFKPGAEHIEYIASSTILDKAKISYLSLPTNNSISVSFRFCAPGEIISEDTIWVECSTGTYSFSWNSTVCESCFDHADCMGTTEAEVHAGYWREDLNSTDVMKWFNSEACEGGYHPEYTNPTKWKTGYTGFLCSEWEITEEVKYERLAAYECSKCPDPILNTIRFVVLLLLAFGFTLTLIGITIRKTKESQISILIRIFTNYIQLVAAALSFGFRIPSFFTNISTSFARFGSISETFLSFDCFIDDTEVKLFTPSNEIFKVFVIIIMPIGIISIISVIWLLLYLMWRKKFKDVKRYIVITIIWVLFLLHPTIAKVTLSLFEWEAVSSSVSKMKMHLDFEWFSSDHLYWIALIAVPSLIVWVIGTPLVAFIFLFINRNNLNSEGMKRHFLLLYQGLKPKAFYWEFMNSIRKVTVLIFSTVLSILSVYYTALTTIILLFFFAKLQEKVNPYEYANNNRLEIKAIVAGGMALYWGVLFEKDKENDYIGFQVLSVTILLFINVRFLLDWIYMFIRALDYKNKTVYTIIQILAFILFESDDIEINGKEDQDDNINLNEDEKESKINEIVSLSNETNRDLSPRYAKLLRESNRRIKMSSNSSNKPRVKPKRPPIQSSKAVYKHMRMIDKGQNEASRKAKLLLVTKRPISFNNSENCLKRAGIFSNLSGAASKNQKEKINQDYNVEEWSIDLIELKKK